MHFLKTSELTGKRILVVDDEYFAAEHMAQTVRNAGGSVVGPVPTVQQALELIETEPTIDGALLDIKLGDETSFPVAKLLKERGIPVIFVTGYDSWYLPDELDDLPILQKPEGTETIGSLFSSVTRKPKA
jgi:CheY-like chemotaxis protein